MPTPHVDASEVLYRQIGPGGDPIYFDPARNPPVHQSRFLPTSKDSDGLSLVRSSFRTAVWAAHRREQPAVRFRLAELQAARLRELALELGFEVLTYGSTSDRLDDEFGEPWAHCVIVEINRVDYDNNSDSKRRIKDWAMGVVKLISDQNVIGPFQEPTDRDPYRPVTSETSR